MKNLSMSAVILITASILNAAPKDNNRYYLVQSKDTKLAGLKTKALLKESNGLTVVQLNAKDITKLSSSIHDERFTCGGFIDLSVDMKDKNLSLQQAFELNSNIDAQQTTNFDYQINNQEIVKKNLALVSKSSFENLLRDFSSFPDRFANNKNGVDAAEWLANKAEQFAKQYDREIEVQRYETPSYEQPSIVVKIKGKDSSKAGVLMGGHMDTYPWNKPGVDDDASGTIASLEVLRAILESKLNFETDIYFAFYSAEEWGLHGSKKVANSFKAKKIPLQAVMQLDMISYSKGETKKLHFVTDNVNDKLTIFTKELATTYLSIAQNEIGDTECGYACSDHASWTVNDYPSVLPFETSFDNMNRHIHRGSDAMDKADIDHAFRFVQLGFSFIAELANPI